MLHRAQELWVWLQTLSAPFAFMLALPFVVATIGLVSLWVRSQLHVGIEKRVE